MDKHKMGVEKIIKRPVKKSNSFMLLNYADQLLLRAMIIKHYPNSKV